MLVVLMRLFVLGGGRIIALAGRGGKLGGDPGGELAIARWDCMQSPNVLEMSYGQISGVAGEMSVPIVHKYSSGGFARARDHQSQI